MTKCNTPSVLCLIYARYTISYSSYTFKTQGFTNEEMKIIYFKL